MTWTATAGDTNRVSDAGNLTDVVATNGVKTITVPNVLNDGTTAGLSAAARAIMATRNAQGTLPVVPKGTALDLTTPAVAAPPAPPAGFDAWQTAWNAYIRLARLLSQDVPSVTQARVDSAKANHESLYDPSFEAFV